MVEENNIEHKKIVQAFTETLLELEKQGELVLTTAFPQQAAEMLFHAALKARFAEVIDEPVECTMPYLLQRTAVEISSRFGMEDSRAQEIVNKYYKKWCETRTIAEIAQVYWHETPHEMASRAFYHIELAKPDDRDFEYLDWRQSLSGGS